jgi:carboxylesterase type B
LGSGYFYFKFTNTFLLLTNGYFVGLKATHSSEIFYVFGTLSERPEVKEVTPTAAKLSQMMMDYWISFANTLDPNDGKGSIRKFELADYTFDFFTKISIKVPIGLSTQVRNR